MIAFCNTSVVSRRWLPLGVVLLVLGGCRGPRAGHPVDVNALVNWVPASVARTSAFEPVSGMERGELPASEPKLYLMGVGDLIEVRVLPPTSVVGLEQAVTGPVRDDGSLYLPIVRKVHARDRTVQEVEAEIVAGLKGYAVDPLVSVDVVEYRARQCRIVGEGVPVEQTLPVNGRLTLLDALIRAGATRSENADRDEAYLIRAGKVHPFSITAMVRQGDAACDIILEEGDHIVVPSVTDRKDHVYVFGQVAEPGRFEMDHLGRPGTLGRLSLLGAIGMAGGINEGTADCNRICLFRGNWQDVTVLRLSVPELYHAGNAISLEPGDRIYVAPNGLTRFNMGLQQFLPSLSGAGNLTGLFLSGAALYQSSK